FFAGRLRRSWVVGLSGTPAACLAAFHLMARSLLMRLAGRRHAVRPLVDVALAAGFPRATDRTRALWARVGPGGPGGPAGELLVGGSAGDLASLLSDTAGSDSARMAGAGAAVVVAGGPAETFLRLAGPADHPERLVALAGAAAEQMRGAPPAVVFIEGFQHPSRPVIQVGPQKPESE